MKGDYVKIIMSLHLCKTLNSCSASMYKHADVNVQRFGISVYCVSMLKFANEQ